MSRKNAYYEVAVAKAEKQSLLVDALLEESPILSDVPMYASTDGLSNTYEEQTEVVGANVVDLDGPIPVISNTSKLKQVNLTSMAGKIEVGIDKAQQFPGGFEGYIENKLPAMLTKTGMDMEKSIFYNNFRAYAQENGNLLNAGGSGSTNYSMVCVHYSPGEINGLYDENGWGNGKVFSMVPLNAGSVYLDSNGVAVRGMLIKNYFGMQLANPHYVSGIANCDIENDTPSTRTFPTETMIDDMIYKARGTAGNTVIYCHPRVRSYLKQYKQERLNMVAADKNFDSRILAWDDIPIVTSYNLTDGTEATVTGL